MSQHLSDDEFHRMQLQIIEMRTENYQLKDENKKQAHMITDLTEKEVKLDKELKKLTKMKRALSTLNKSKQAQEFEDILRQTEQEFTLQNQTLKQELTRMSVDINKLEKENRNMKAAMSSSENSTSLVDEGEFRRVQAENSALKSKIENLQTKHEEEMQLATNHHHPKQQSTDDSVIQDPLLNNSGASTSQCGGVGDGNEQLIHLEAQCERYRQELKNLQDVQVKCETACEEKSLLEAELSSLRERETNEQKVLSSEIEALRTKFDAKEAELVVVQDERNKFMNDVRTRSHEVDLIRENAGEEFRSEREKMQSEISSLGKALQTSQNMVDRYQSDGELRKKEVSELNSKLKEVTGERDALLQRRGETEQVYMQMNTAMNEKEKLKKEMEKLRAEKEDAVTKFEESARASGELLQRMDQAEQNNVNLERENNELKQLAEKRKQVMDRQAIESQEHNAKFSERLNRLQKETEDRMKTTVDDYDKKVKTLEHRCKQQEQELMRVHQQDRGKTRELDSLQQQMRNMESEHASLENSRGWFERALKDAEKAAELKEKEHLENVEKIRGENREEIEKINLRLVAKDEELAKAEERVQDAGKATEGREDEIKRLKQEIKDSFDHQKLVEKKGLSTLKDLKRQLLNEKKKNEKLQEKLKEISSNHSNLDELLQVVDQSNQSTRTNSADGGSSVSSFSIRDLITPHSHHKRDHSISSDSQVGVTSNGQQHQMSSTTSTSGGNGNMSPAINKYESRDLLNRITSLQQEKWTLEERVKHLEDSAAGMAEELLEKNRLMEDYVKNTRTDASTRTRPNHEELAGSRKFSDRFKSLLTGQDEEEVANVKEMNKKLMRMLEEEMTKNRSLKEDLIAVTTQQQQQAESNK